MKYSKRYIVFTIIIAITFLTNFYIYAMDNSTIERFRGASLDAKTWNPIVAADVNAGTIKALIDNKEYTLREAIDYVQEEFEYIIIDCPPSLNMLTVNAMTTANTVLVPIQCEYYALEGLSQLMYTINLVQDRLNPKLKMEGVVFTMYDSRTNLSNQVVENVKENIDTIVYKTVIPRNIRLAEAPSHGLPINLYDSKSAGAESYRQLAKEVISNDIETEMNVS